MSRSSFCKSATTSARSCGVPQARMSDALDHMTGLHIARVDGVLRRLRCTICLPVPQNLQVIPQHAEAAAFQLRLQFAALQLRQNGRLLPGDAEICRQLFRRVIAAQAEQPCRKVDHIASCPAAEAVEVILVQLRAGRAVIVKRAADHVPLPDRQSVPLRRHARMNGGLHGFK